MKTSNRNGFTRRRWLRGAGGVALVMPFLETFAPKTARGNIEGEPRRFVGYQYSNGVRTEVFWPEAEPGTLTEAHFANPSRATHHLAPYMDKLLLVEGLDTRPSFREVAGHVHGNAKRWTASRFEYGDDFGTNEYNLQLPVGPSVDQVIAEKLHPGRPPLLLRTRFPSSVIPYDTISWRGNMEPATMEGNPWNAYQDIVGLSTADAETRARVIARRESVMDLVREDLDSLQSERSPLSAGDRAVVDQHLQMLRELEEAMHDINLVEPLPQDRVDEMEAISSDPANLVSSEFRPAINRINMDILAMALAGDVARASLLLFGRGSDSSTYRWLDQTEGHHGISHGYANDIPDWVEQLRDIDQWHVEEFLYLVERLASYPEPGPAGDTLLDNTVAVFTNEMGQGHSVWDVPYILAGSCGGYFRQGQYVRLDDTHNRLLTTIMNAVGCRDDDGGPMTNFGVPGFGKNEYESAELATLPEGEISALRS